MEAFLVSVWVIRLLKPEWILTYYVPALGPIRSIAAITLYALILYAFLAYSKHVKFDPTFGLYIGAILCSTLLAQFTGLARQGLQGVIEQYFFYAANLAAINALAKDTNLIDRILKVYIGTLVFYGISGIAFKGLVPFHVFLNNEDAFGPFMAVGMPLALLLAFREYRLNYWMLGVAALCTVGLIASFARGAFLSFCCAAFFVWLRSSNKGSMTLFLAIGAILFGAAASVLFDPGVYWEEMSTINKSLQDEKQEGRHFLRKKALELYAENPIFGVGPKNFGPSLVTVTSESEASDRGVQSAHYWNRVTHSIYFQILSELGTVGAATFMLVLIWFWRKSRQLQRACRSFFGSVHQEVNNERVSTARRIYYTALALEAVMVSFLVSGLFYDLLFYHWFVDVLILNSMLYLFAKNHGYLSTPRGMPMAPFYRTTASTLTT
jgi:O-antigen ligase